MLTAGGIELHVITTPGHSPGSTCYYSEQLAVPPVQEVCDGRSRCKEFSDLLRVSGIASMRCMYSYIGKPCCA